MAEVTFGEWLKRRRNALGLTQKQLALQISCSTSAVRKFEGETRRPSAQMVEKIAQVFNIPLSERESFLRYARGDWRSAPSEVLEDSPWQHSIKIPPSNLPASITSFVGREKEQSNVIRLIAMHRLATLTGSGGVGKTRLAMKVGEAVLRNYPDGVWVVELAPILDPLLVPRTTAIAIGLRDEPQRPVIDMLSDYLRKKEMLIILDNCEHLLQACAQFADALLKRCPGLKILATSREALGMLGEAVYPVHPLELPDMQQVLEIFRDYESVRLFEKRAQLAQMDFSLTIENASSVAEICTRLGGIPLAIELAAARINVLSTEQIAARLQKRFDLLIIGNRTALPRHQTLQAAIDWSYDLLSLPEQTVFQRLSVFVDGWTLEAAESICAVASVQPETILAFLTQLVNKSLVIIEGDQGKTRYRMLETLRQYAYDKLVESGERDTLLDRHLEYFLRLAETAAPHLIRPEQLEWLTALEADHENLRLALERSLSKEAAEPSLTFCTSLTTFWRIRSYWLEGLSWVKSALAKHYQNENVKERVVRVRALATHAFLEWQTGEFEQMLPPAQESLKLALEISDKRDIAIAKFFVGIALRGRDLEQAISLMEQAFADFQTLNDVFWQAMSFPYLGECLVSRGKLKMRDRVKISVQLAHKAGERLILADVSGIYATWLVSINRLNEAIDCAKESEELYKQIGSSNPNENSFVFAQVAWLEGDLKKARSLYIEMLQRYTLLGEKAYKSIASRQLGLLEIDAANLSEARTYLEQSLVLSREIGFSDFIAQCLVDLSLLSHLEGDLETFKQNFRESFSLKNYLYEDAKVFILGTILRTLYIQIPECSAQILGVLDRSEREWQLPLFTLEKRYCIHAEAHIRKTLGKASFDSLFGEGQKISLGEALDLVLHAVEEM